MTVHGVVQVFIDIMKQLKKAWWKKN